MKVQYVSIIPTQQAKDAGCYEFTPELLAAIGARYSRNNEGLDAIAQKIDPFNLDKSVDSIFRMVDYGHASIADMTPISFFIDDISLFAAYYLWTLSPTAGGQECSTRYIKLDDSSLISSEDLGIPHEEKSYFDHYNKYSFETYQTCLDAWSKIADENPSLTKIPQSLLDSDLDKDKKQVARMKRNFAFDRARIYLPVSAATGVMMIQSARAWASICSHLNSHYLKELRNIGAKLTEQLALGAPRLIKHSKATDSLRKYILDEYSLLQSSVNSNIDFEVDDKTSEIKVQNFLNVDDLYYDPELIRMACEHRVNRYSPFGNIICRTNVKFSWAGISFGEIRDLNRHRTGNKYCPMIPLGFYSALDQLPSEETDFTTAIKTSAYNFKDTAKNCREQLQSGLKEYIYFSNLGHQYYFEHSTTADKFLYEMELRTGVGAHYKYAEHCREVLHLWYEKYPATKGLLFEGSAEPE